MQLTILPDIETMYAALVRKDCAYEGIFYAAIKTTGIFCRPTCHARKPKPENVEYFGATADALRHGYRPCKVCHPMEKKGATPIWLVDLLSSIAGNNTIKLTDSDLRARGMEPARVRRWFQQNHSMTFQTYLRSMRINSAFGQIREGDKVIQSAYENGYESLSGFLATFKKTTGFLPKESKHQNVIIVTRFATPLGPMIAGATDDGICLLEFTDRRMLETQIARLKKFFSAELLPGTSKYFPLLQVELEAYFDGKLSVFKTPVVAPGSEFQQKVWQALLEIPYGQVRTYKEQSVSIGNLKAIRAVAKANGDNRLAIIIPCHRVIGTDGAMVGYGGGVWRKQWMLDLEKKQGKERIDDIPGSVYIQP